MKNLNKKENNLKFSYIPPIVDISCLPNGVRTAFINLGTYKEKNIDKAIQDAVKAGYILPRHSDNLIFVKATDLGYIKKENNQDGWHKIETDEFILCYYEGTGLYALVSFEKLAKLCRHNENNYCVAHNCECHELKCKIWSNLLTKKIKEEDYNYGRQGQ